MYFISVSQLAEKINNLERFTTDELQYKPDDTMQAETTEKTDTEEKKSHEN